MVARHIWGHFQPWVRDDIRELNACLPLGVREGPYIGLHIRRGDKLAHEAHLTPAEDYLTVAVDTLLHRNEECTGARQLLVDECKLGMLLLPEHINGIFVASDDDVVVEEIRELVPLFLPNVKAENVVYMSDGKVSLPRVSTSVHDVDVNRLFPAANENPTTSLSLPYPGISLHLLVEPAVARNTLNDEPKSTT